MSVLKSLFFGSEGSYKVLGIPVDFRKLDPSEEWEALSGAGLVSKIASHCLNSTMFRFLTQGYVHVFVHETSHAIACKLLTPYSPHVNIYTDACTGDTRFQTSKKENYLDWQNNIINAVGPMGNIAFSSCELIAATALKSYLSWPVALALGGGAVMWIAGELLYVTVSTIQKDGGDFGDIAKSNKTHLALAGAALVGECALGMLAAYAVS